MNRHRYEPVPQRDAQNPVILSPIPTPSSSFNTSNNTHYNFNTGLPSSSSSIAPSIPNSPPPSFHSTSSPGTPRPLPSQELWGVAPSTIGTEVEGGGTSNDALATIAGLKQRVEWLEESIGRLLLAKEQQPAFQSENEDDDSGSGGRRKRHNCCVTFTDASPDMERAVGRGDNCCVSFKSGGAKTRERQKQMRWMLVGCFCFVVAVVGFTVIMTSGGRGVVSTNALEGEGVEVGLN